jgi:UDP-N-acetylmuramate--alanine ligase
MNRLDSVQLDKFKNAYFIGIGGIGMSALARYFNQLGWKVAGYDKTPSPLTTELENEGIQVHFNDELSQISEEYKNVENTLVVYTPAIPKDHAQLNWFKSKNGQLYKRSEVLGILTRHSKGLGVAGTHGKTTTSSMLAHILHQSSSPCNAFLGGIATNFNSNLVVDPTAEYTVIEADEFDRSFLNLRPFASIITSMDPDHLDIYDTTEAFAEGFQHYAALTAENGFLVIRKGLELNSVKAITYGMNEPEADVAGSNLKYDNGRIYVDVVVNGQFWKEVELGLPGNHNAENALACIALTSKLGISESEIRSGLATFKGVKRRFEFHVRSEKWTYIDDYAHHPTEIQALISSVRMMYPNKTITAIFQPHLFSRTRDFFEGFAKELSAVDHLILLPIYPARELPIEGITSVALLAKTTARKSELLEPEKVIQRIEELDGGVLLTVGAGDIDRLIVPLKSALQ